MLSFTVLCLINALVWLALTLLLVSVVGPVVPRAYKKAVGPCCMCIMFIIFISGFITIN